MLGICIFIFFFFNDTATTEIYTLSLHDALPIWTTLRCASPTGPWRGSSTVRASTASSPSGRGPWASDRKSTRLNSSHLVISYAVFCLKKKKQQQPPPLILPYHTPLHTDHPLYTL